jgi:hypothetical protein
MRVGIDLKSCLFRQISAQLPQPAYSPEVNQVSHLWEELREKYLHNRLFSSLDLLVEVLCQGLNELTDDKERLRSMMSFPHLNVSV